MNVKFKTKIYECLNIRQSSSSDGAHRLAILLTGVESIDGLKTEASNCERIEVTDAGEIQVYEGYINYEGISEKDNNIVEIYLQQDNLMKKLEKLTTTVREQENIIEAQSQIISEQENRIMQLQYATENLNETQADQDDAINYLLMNEETAGSEE